MELKTAKKSSKKTLKQAWAEGHAQFAKNDYTADLRAAGLTNIHSMVVESAKKPKKNRTTKKAAVKKDAANKPKTKR